MKRVLITGVAGFIGRQLARSYIREGWLVDGVGTRAPENAPSLDRYLQAYLPDSRLEDFVRQRPPDVCIHCSGRASIGLSMQNPREDFQASLAVTFELCETLRRYAPDARLIFLSSAAIYGNPKQLPVDETQQPAPVSAYGYHKLLCEILLEEYARLYGLSSTSVRIFSAYGPGLRRQVIWDMCQKAMNNEVLSVCGTGAESRDFVHVHDIVAAIRILERCGDGNGNIYNLGSGAETRIDDLVRMLLGYLGRPIRVEYDGNVPKGSPLNWRADIQKIAALGYVPSVSLENGLKDFVRWFMAADS